MSAHSGVIGEAEGLDQLYAEYERGNPVIKAKIGSLQARFKQMRRIRGDGNCFYRAFAVGLLSTYPQVPSASWTCEACSLCNQDNLLACSVCDTPRQTAAVVAEAGRQKLLALVNSSLLQPFASNRLPHLSSSELQFATADSVQNIQRLLQFLSTFELTAPATANILAKQVFGQRELTDALVGLFRVLAADYLRAHEPELSPFLVEGDMDSYISTQVLVDSVEGEGLAITALTNVFRDVALVRIHFLNSDATLNNVPAIYEYPSDSSEPEAPRLVLNLLFRPGHYDLLLE